MRPPGHSARHPTRRLRLHRAVHLDHEPQQQVEHRGQVDELEEEKQRDQREDPRRAGNSTKYAPSTPAIAPLAPITGTVERGAIQTVAIPAATPAAR